MLLEKLGWEATLPPSAEAGTVLSLLWRNWTLRETRAVSFFWTESEILLALEQARRWPHLLGKDLQGTVISLKI